MGNNKLNKHIVKFLISKGANKNAQDNNGKTPFDVAETDVVRNILKN